jgi:hypothetical protein
MATTGAERERKQASGRPIDNERKACDAVARSLERLTDRQRTNAHSLEDRGAAAP